MESTKELLSKEPDGIRIFVIHLLRILRIIFRSNYSSNLHSTMMVEEEKVCVPTCWDTPKQWRWQFVDHESPDQKHPLAQIPTHFAGTCYLKASFLLRQWSRWRGRTWRGNLSSNLSLQQSLDYGKQKETNFHVTEFVQKIQKAKMVVVFINCAIWNVRQKQYEFFKTDLKQTRSINICKWN